MVKEKISMQSFLCRVMTAVFAFNCFIPAPGVWAQSSSRAATSLSIERHIDDSVKQQVTDSIAQALEDLELATNTSEMAQAIVKLHKAMDKKYTVEKEEQALAEEAARQKQIEKERYTAKQSSTYVAATRIVPKQKIEENEILARLAKDDLKIDQIIDYIDPFDPSQYDVQNTIYASEILGNSIDAFLMQPDTESIYFLNDFVLLAQLRILYRLNKLMQNPFSSIHQIMAIGTLRITLWKIHQYYIQTNQSDPLLEPNTDSSSTNNVLTRYPNMKDGPMMINIQPSKDLQSFLLPPDIYEQFNKDFLTELSALKAKNPKEGSQEYQLLLTLSDYATVYAMMNSPQSIPAIVNLFDEGPKRSLKGNVIGGKFQQPYSAVLNSIFTTIFESVKYIMPTPSSWTQMIYMLEDFSDPKKYSVPTRIFALETASLMYSSNPSCQANTANAPVYPTLMRCNSGTTNENDPLRITFAARTVDLYAPLNHTHFAAMEDYGLDSKQMQMLADKLAYIYNGFANDELKMDHSRSRMKNSYVLDKGVDGRTLILNDQNSIPRLVPINQGQQFQLPDGSLKTISGFGRASDGHWVEMQLVNGINAKKADDEMKLKFTLFVGNAIFWIYGGEILSLIGTAYRTTKGAMMALPKAINAATKAGKGARFSSFGAEIQKGVRYNNLIKTLNKNGIKLYAVREAEVKVPKNNRLPVPKNYKPETKPQVREITSISSLQNKYSKINPKRWLGINRPNSDRIFFIQNMPNFRLNSGTADLAESPLSAGIKNWDDWEQLFSSFTSTGTRMAPRSTPNWLSSSAKAQLKKEKPIIQAAAQALNIDKKANTINTRFFDYWKYTENGWTRVSQQDFLDTRALFTEKLPDYYKLLGISRNASEKEIRQAFLKKIKEIHPDKNVAAEANAQTALLNEAYRTLKDPLKRRKYLMDFEKTRETLLQSPSGSSLVISPKGKGPDKGLVVNPQNAWQIEMELPNYLLKTNQLDVLNGLFLQNTMFWRGFKANMIFFGGWAGLDFLTYSPMQSWVLKAAQADQLAELSQYGDTFDSVLNPQKAEETKETTSAEQTPGPSTFEDVTRAQESSSEGTLLTFPILGIRHSIPKGWWGNLSFVTDQEKALYQYMSMRLQLNKALNEQVKARKEKEAQTQKEEWEKFRVQAKESLTQNKALLEEYFFYQGGEQAKKEISVIMQDYIDQVMAVLDSKEAIEVQYEKIASIQHDFEQKIQQKQEEWMRMQELLQTEEYIPDYGTGTDYNYSDDSYFYSDFEEEPVESY